MNNLNPPTGMRDFLPQQKALRESRVRVIQETYQRYGFEGIETPALEEMGRLNMSEGGDNQKMIFSTLRRRLRPEQVIAAAERQQDLVDLGLRYDLTVPLARFYATHRAELPQVFRAMQIGPVWRAERPQAGRFRQFTQCDIDIIGESGVLAEAELFQATAAVLDQLGVQGWRIRVNSRPLLSAMLDLLQVPSGAQAAVLIAMDKFDKIGRGGVLAEIDRLALPAAVTQNIDDYFQDVIELYEEAPGGLEDLRTLVPAGIRSAAGDIENLLGALPDALRNRIIFDPLLIRGMGYYTGLIYEISVPGVSSSIGGGGRYDGMVGRLAGVSAPAVGMSLGFERLIDLATATGTSAQPRIVVVYDRDVTPALLVRFKAELVADGYTVRLERRPRKLPDLLTRLTAAGYTNFVTVRSDTTYLNIKALGDPQAGE